MLVKRQTPSSGYCPRQEGSCYALQPKTEFPHRHRHHDRIVHQPSGKRPTVPPRLRDISRLQEWETFEIQGFAPSMPG
jgi:hypothetical protein